MPLVKATLTASLQAVFEDLDTSKTAAQKAASIADAIDAYIKTATVTVTVATTGTAVAQTGTGTGTLS
jgi:dTDP-glucose pyrophosphorylase